MIRKYHEKDNYEYPVIQTGIRHEILESEEITGTGVINISADVDIIELMLLDNDGTIKFKKDNTVIASLNDLPENTTYEKYLVGIDEIELDSTDARLIYIGYKILHL